MAKHLTKVQSIDWFNKYEYMGRSLFWIQYFEDKSKMNMVHNSAEQYINWYNSIRIQSWLNWKTPASASVYQLTKV